MLRNTGVLADREIAAFASAMTRKTDTNGNQQGVQARTEKEQALGLSRNLLNDPDKFCP